MNIETAIRNASLELKNNLIKSPLLDCELLMSKVLNKDRKFIILNSKKKLSNDLYGEFKKLVSYRSRGKPVAYLTGLKSFWKYEFCINENVLIPRPDTEILIQEALYCMPKDRSISRAIGVSDIREYLKKKTIKENVIEKISIKTRQYAKRQRTWANNNMQNWIKLNPNELNKFLKKF